MRTFNYKQIIKPKYDIMGYNYVYLLFFIIFSIATPISFLFASKLLRKNYDKNPVKNAPYESGEETIGKLLDTDSEYFPFIMLFLPFEIISVLLLLFSSYFYSVDFKIGLELNLLLVFSMLSAFGGYFLIKYKR